MKWIKITLTFSLYKNNNKMVVHTGSNTHLAWPIRQLKTSMEDEIYFFHHYIDGCFEVLAVPAVVIAGC